MEILEANKKIFHQAEVSVRDQAVVRMFQWTAATNQQLDADAMEIMLFCIKSGRVCLQASFIPHPLELNNGEAIFLAYPREAWSVNMIATEQAEFYITRIPISALHKLINPGFDASQLKDEQRFNMRDLIRIIPLSPALTVAFDQLFHHKLNAPFSSIFEQGKFLEIFSLLMENAFGQQQEVCPIAMSPSIEQKLSQVRRYIIENIDRVPDPDQLALQFDLPRQTLKEGYKFKFGKSIHQFHAEHKLEYAMQMLSSGEMLVKEIAFKIGYQNPSHFIAAFKKKFGFTPKQFIKQSAHV